MDQGTDLRLGIIFESLLAVLAFVCGNDVILATIRSPRRLKRGVVAQVAPVPGLTFILELLREPEMDWDAVKDRIGGLNSEATIATFLAAVQAQVLALSYQDNSTGVKVATNALGFAGVLLDVLTACLALLASTLLQRHTAIVERQLALIEDTSPERLAEIRKVLNALPRFMVPSNLYRRVEDRHAVIVSIESAAAAGQSRPQLRFRDASRDRAPTIGTSFKAIQSVVRIVDTATVAMLGGILCFFASVLFLAISTQPHAVWIVSTVICSLAVGLPVLNQVWGWLKMKLGDAEN